ncbi:hypothetical protein M404DRAFT_30453 [Pisolithus tinctorius Marx 270]|uniref:RNA-directed DNA polymerase n=1 Tax=Pisolithus tinctorius Marx 270 TaxID=870435 RepID=A0A0C3NVG9_PISTI|nr:hypothetical protein M404DRAFT_30453 [Pisolithus tinctorius Marx 270]
MQIPVALYASERTLNIINATALVDSGAEISCINWGFVQKHRIPTQQLTEPILAINADGTQNAKGKILFSATLYFRIKGLVHQFFFHIINCGLENVILGLPWLQENNPIVDWRMGTLSIDEKTNRSKELTHNISCVAVEEPTMNLVSPTKKKGINKFMDYKEPENETIHAHFVMALGKLVEEAKKTNPKNSLLRKITMATELAQEEHKKKLKAVLPAEYKDFTLVFNKPSDGILPPSRPYDHALNLVEDFILKVAKAYPLSPSERESAEKFIKENLREGKIHPSKSPQAAPFFFVGKKDGSLHPYLVDKLNRAFIFTKMDVRSGYNNVHIKEGDQWKAVFIMHKALFEPTVMFFRLCNSPATFQHFMNNSFRDMITEGWLVVYMDDLLIFSMDHEEHRQRTCHAKVEYLSMIIKENTVTMDPVKVQGIAKWPVPKKEDPNGQWQPCAFIPQLFNPAERNYDIYDRELLGVIRGLKTWRHYLHGSLLLVKVFTNHKNLTYFKAPQNLNHHQAHWLLNLTEFDLQLEHIPGKDLAASNALSHQTDHVPDDNEDNKGVTLLPQTHVYPIVQTALHAIENVNMPLPFKSHLSDWQFDNGVLLYKDQVYIPNDSSLQQTVVSNHHDHPSTGHPSVLKT